MPAAETFPSIPEPRSGRRPAGTQGDGHEVEIADWAGGAGEEGVASIQAGPHSCRQRRSGEVRLRREQRIQAPAYHHVRFMPGFEPASFPWLGEVLHRVRHYGGGATRVDPVRVSLDTTTSSTSSRESSARAPVGTGSAGRRPQRARSPRQASRRAAADKWTVPFHRSARCSTAPRKER